MIEAIFRTIEPFNKLVNQGMILGEMEFTGYRDVDEQWVSCKDAGLDDDKKPICKSNGNSLHVVKLEAEQVEKLGDQFVLKSDSKIVVDSRAHKMSKSPRQCHQPGRNCCRVRCRRFATL